MHPVRRTLTLIGAVSALLVLTPFAANAASPGDPDPTFGGGDGMAEVSLGTGGFPGTVLSTTGGKVLVVGEDGASNVALARTLANGDPDPMFGGGDGLASTAFLSNLDMYNGLAVLAGGKIMVAADVAAATHDMLGLGRFTAAGVPDASFGGGDGALLVNFGKAFYAYDLLALPSGKLLVAGELVQSGDDTNFMVARLNANGTFDHSFGGGDGRVATNFGPGSDGAWRIALDSHNRIAVAGWAEEVPSPGYDTAVARYTENGAPDHSFSGDGKLRLNLIEHIDDYTLGLGIQGDKIVLGVYCHFSGTAHVVIVRTQPNGQMDPAFGGGDGQVISPNASGERELEDLAIDADGRIVVAGREDASPDQLFAARYGPNGKLDTGFGDEGFALSTFGTDVNTYGLSIAGSGKIVVVGSLSTGAGVARFLP